MAPQRGGGGHRSSGSSCGPDAFSSMQEIILLTFMVLFFVSSLGLSYLYPVRRKTARLRGHARDGALWTVLGISLVLESIVLILDIASFVGSECAQDFQFTFIYLAVTSSCLGLIISLLLLGAMLLPITRLMHECAGGIMPRAKSICHKVFVGLMGVNVIACIALLIWFITDIGNAYYTQFAGGYYGNYAGLFIIIDGGLGVIGSFVGILAFIIAIRGAPQLRRSGKFRALAYLFSLALFAKYVTSLVLIWVPSGIEGYILNHIFLLGAMTAVLYFVPNAALAYTNNTEPPRYESGAAPPRYDARYNPVSTFPQDEVHWPRENRAITETYDVPPIPHAGKPQELPGGYAEAHRPPSSPGPYSHPAELPHQP
ncbi:hypothetical protein MauCBS54593_006707 [Microsporum audouinii]